MSQIVRRASTAEVQPLRDSRFSRVDYQYITYSWHQRGWTDAYILEVDQHTVGYGLVGGPPGEPRDQIVEFDCMPSRQAAAPALMRRMIALSGANTIRTQTNDTLLTLLLLECAARIRAEAVLFRDAATTHLCPKGASFRAASPRDRSGMFEHSTEPVGDWVIEVNGAVAATGGVLYHYNPPFGDIFMEVAVEHRRRGLGSYLVQELKRVCIATGSTPAARCDARNDASRATLQRAGFLPCARVLLGELSASAPR